MDGAQVMEFLNIQQSRHVGQALDFLMEIRIEEGLLGDAEIRRRLQSWWDLQKKLIDLLGFSEYATQTSA